VTVGRDEERSAGRKARAEYLERARAQGYRAVESPERLAYLRALVDRFAGRMAHRDRYPRIDVTLIDAPVADGQAFPGGSLVFSTALLDEPDEATVAGVVAHELAHLDRGHMYEMVRRGKLSASGSNTPAPSTFDEIFTRQAALFGMMFRPFRPEQEHEADCTAATWMYQEGYDPRALAGFFERLNRRRNDAPDNPFLSFARTHPYSLDRRDHVRARLAQLQRWKPRDDLGLYAENLKRLSPRPVAEPKGR
jgi:predicted Zn-dependent protease